MTNTTTHSGEISNLYWVRVVLVALIFAIAGVFILIYHIIPQDEINLELGDVAPKNVSAPEQIIYTSEIDTKAARDRAGNSVSTIYRRPDPAVAREQVDRLRRIFDYIETVRADPYASLAQKFEWISAIPDLTLSDTVIDEILIMNDEAWGETKVEALAILNEVMRSEIREAQVLSTRRQLPAKVALDTPTKQADVIVAITEDLIKPNTFPDDERTEAERQAAVDAVEPVIVTVEENQIIIPAGQVVGPKQLEAIEALGLQEPQFSWMENLVVPAILILLVTVIIGVHFYQYNRKLLTDTRKLVLLALLVLIAMLIAKFMMPGEPIIVFLYPIAALSMMIVILTNAQLAFLITTIVAFLAGYMAGEESFTVAIYLTLSGWIAILALGRSQRVNSLVWSGVYVAVVNAFNILAFNLSIGETDLTSAGILLLAGVGNGIFSAGLAIFGLFAIGNIFGMTTAIQLADLERPTQPLLRQLLLKAPGTYHHSLMVSNLAQQAAERIGANAMLVRVMAYYHDIGKMQRPYFFIENQPDGMSNVHEKLDPQVSAQIIISHVTDGLELAQKYRLPKTIRDGIAQHQGTGLVRYFYYQALEAAKEKGGEVDESKFHYPGPRPQTKETGILMLADISESTVRALKPTSAEEIDEIVRKAIAHHLEVGQLDECDLTIADLSQIRTAFVDILQGVHHPRIKYPEPAKTGDDKQTATPAGTKADEAGNTSKPQPAEKPSPAAPQPLNNVSAAASRPARLVRRE